MSEVLDSNKDQRSGLKTKYFIIPLLIGWGLTGIGRLFRMQSWPGASEMLTIGTALTTLSYLFLCIKLLSNKDPESFLNK